MANYNGQGRSNYVQVVDIEKAKDIAEIFGCSIYISPEGNGVCFFSNSEDGGHNTMYTPDVEEDVERYKSIFAIEKEPVLGEEVALPGFVETIAGILQPEQVFIWVHTGHEKLRFLDGYAIAINKEGKTMQVSLDDIYDKAKSLGSSITRALY
jgi:hypothetical protein